jgi:hypothetical protein
MYRGTLIELTISVEVTPPSEVNSLPSWAFQAILDAKNTVRNQFTINYSILVGK